MSGVDVTVMDDLLGLRSAMQGGMDWVAAHRTGAGPVPVPAAVREDEVAFWFAALGVFVVGTYVALGLPWLALEFARLPWVERYRLQPDRVRPRLESARYAALATANLVAVTAAFLAPVALLCSRLGGGLLLEVRAPVPPAPHTLALLAFYQWSEDFTFFFSHWALHTPWLYRAVHKTHHEFKAPFAYVAIYADPLEVLLGNYLPAFSGPLALIALGYRPHLACVMLWVALRIVYTLHVHSGYDFPWSAERFLGLYAGPVHHDAHHRLFRGNYGSTLTYLDRLFGTRVEDYAAAAAARGREPKKAR